MLLSPSLLANLKRDLMFSIESTPRRLSVEVASVSQQSLVQGLLRSLILYPSMQAYVMDLAQGFRRG